MIVDTIEYLPRLQLGKLKPGSARSKTSPATPRSLNLGASRRDWPRKPPVRNHLLAYGLGEIPLIVELTSGTL